MFKTNIISLCYIFLPFSCKKTVNKAKGVFILNNNIFLFLFLANCVLRYEWLSLHKISCTSAKRSSKLDALLSVCIIFA